jgi:alanyl-tRNA synthetase
VLAGKLADVDAKSLRDFTDNLKTKLGSGIIILASTDQGRLSFVVSVTQDKVTAGFNAGKIAKGVAGLIGGSGGGKPDFAQGGGKNPEKFEQALAKLQEIIK